MVDDKFRPRAYPLYVVCALLAAGLVAYAVTDSFAWDEGFHLVAAQLIKAGRRPYIDWLFPQTPLNAYWNAFWMRLIRENWRTTHAVAAVESSLAALLTGIFALKKFPAPRWRLAISIFCATMVAANITVVEFATIAQAYAFCLLSIVAGFWFTTMAVDRESVWTPFAAGLASGIAAGGSLLTAPVSPALLLWMLLCNRSGSRLWKLVAFVAGVIVAFVPVIRLFAMGPRQTWFAIVKYHLYYRQVAWDGAIRHDLETVAGLIDSPQALFLLLLALFGLLFVFFRSGWDRARKQEFYLCLLVTIAETIHLSSAHPTFSRYFLLTTPFMSYLAGAGIYFAGTRLWGEDRPWLPVTLLCAIMTLGAAKAVYDSRDDIHWRDLEGIANKVAEVIPANRPMVADEAVFFLTHRLPPPGLAGRDSHKLTLAPAEADLLHVIMRPELEKQVQDGKYYAVEFCEDDDWFDAKHLTPIFKNHADVGDCSVYWDFTGPASK
jgi:hypothetical protein